MRKIISLSICLISLVSYSQQTPQRNLYGFNKYAINPAYAGSNGCTEMHFSHLNQWVKVEGAPLTSMITANGLIGKSLGVGGQILVDQIGMIQQVSAMGTASYGFSVAKTHNLRIGASFGYNQYRIDATNAIAFDSGDPIIDGGEQAGGTINTNIGLLYNWKNLEVSLGSEQVIQSTTNMSLAGVDGYGLRRHLNAYIAYNQNIGSNWVFTPSIYSKGTNNGHQIDFNADAFYKRNISGGIGFRTGVGLIARAGIQIKDFFFMGYAYEAPMGNIASYSSGSHEVILGIKFCKKEAQKKTELEDLSEFKKQHNDSTNIDLNNQITSEAPAMDTVVITRVDTVFVEAPIIELNKVEIVKAPFQPIDKDILFEYNKSIVQRESFAELESLINILNTRAELNVSLRGYTDSDGSDNYNVSLSKKRVNAVKEFLIANGIDKNRILIDAFGEKNPIADNSSANGKRLNRRVEVRLIER